MLFWTRKGYAKIWLYYNFSSLNKCDTQVGWKWSIFSPVGTRQDLKSKTWNRKCRFSQKCRIFWKKKTHGVFTLTEPYLYANVGRVEFFKSYRTMFDFCGHLLSIFFTTVKLFLTCKSSYSSAISALTEKKIYRNCGYKHDKTTHVVKNFG